MPPNTSDGPLNTLEQIRDLLAQVLGQQGDGDRSESREDPKPAKKPRSPDGEKAKPGRTALDHGLGIMSGLGGAPAQLAALMRNADSIGKNILALGEKIGNWWNPKKEPEATPVATAPRTVQPQGDQKTRQEPTQPNQQPTPIQQPAPLQPIQPTPQQTPPVASPVPVAPVLAAPTVPTPQPQQQPTLAAPTVPTIPAPQSQPRQEVPAITPPAVPVLPTKLDLAPVAPVPLPGLATDVDTRIPRAEREIQQPIGQTAPVLIPGAPGGESGAAPSNDSSRLAAALEKLVVALDKMDKREDDGGGSDGDETEQGENFQRRSMWTDDHTPRTGTTIGSLNVEPITDMNRNAGGDGEKKDALQPGGGILGMIGDIGRMFGS